MNTPGAPHRERRRTGHHSLRLRVAPPASTGAVLLLHGGRSDALTPPPLLNLPSARMRPFGTAILKATAGHEVILASVRYRFRGWNGSRSDPVHDAQEALDELKLLNPLKPVVLVGHSMGARAALRVAGHSHVSGVVALAPWCPPGEPVGHLQNKRLIVLHDEEDRVTHARDSWEFVRSARRAGAQACGITMPRGGHAMLRDAGTWHRLTAALTAGILGAQSLPSCLTKTSAGDSPVLSAHRVIKDIQGTGG
ncbi:alpha/beta hydrolase [Streptomyces sp. NPDC054887]